MRLAMPRPPNLVLFLPDQMRADTLACHGAPAHFAPNLARFAQTATVFERAYVTQPVCTPSRSSIMTGTWPHQNGCIRNNVALPAHFKCLPQLVDGYAAAYFGKWHLGQENSAQRGFSSWISTEGESDYSRWLKIKEVAPDKPDGSYSRNITSKLPAELSKPRFLEEHACRFIAENKDRPFILYVAFVEPHSPYNGPLNDLHSLSEIELDSAALASARDDLPLRYRLMREWQEEEARRDRERLPEQYYFGATPEEYRGMKQRYLGLVTLVDRSIGAILDRLDQLQLTSNTIVVHTSDHGDMLGAQHLFGKEVMFDQAIHVPLLMRVPGAAQPRRVSQLVSLIDLLPTLIDLLGGAPSGQCAGTSRGPLFRGEEMPDESVFLEWSPNRTKVRKQSKLGSFWQRKRAMEESTRTVITPEGWKFNWRDRDLDELYDVGNDSRETINLFTDEKYISIVDRCAQEIRAWQQQTGDRLKLKLS